MTAISAAGREFATEDVFEAGWQAALQHLQLGNAIVPQVAYEILRCIPPIIETA